MNNAVIYARYSSAGQNEQSIEGQLRICKEHAENKGLTVLKTYVDKARTGTNDNRPDFQRMLADAERGNFQFIIVYKFDRFARNRFDSMMHKQTLKKQFNIRVISALEPVSDDEGGEIYEMFLEWNDEKYSKRLSKRVLHGFDTSVANGTYTGAKLICGYKLVDTNNTGKKGTIHKVAIDEEQAEIVRYIFTEYVNGKDKKIIAAELNSRGLRYKGKPFNFRTFEKWLRNEKYTGEFILGGRPCNNMYPQIIDKELFAQVQKRLQQNQILAGAKSATEPYILTGKVFCGHCGTGMTADGGTGRTGKQHHYYACNKKKKGKCDKKREAKNGLEKAVIDYIINFLQNPKTVNSIADDVIAYYEQRTSDNGVKSIEAKIAHAQNKVAEWTVAFVEAKSAMLRSNIEKQIAEYEVLLEDLELQKKQLEIEQGAKLCKKDSVSFVSELIKGDPNDKEHWKKVVDGIVKKVFVYDERFDVFLNITDGDVERINLEDLDREQSVQTLSPIAYQSKPAFLRVFCYFSPHSRPSPQPIKKFYCSFTANICSKIFQIQIKFPSPVCSSPMLPFLPKPAQICLIRGALQ